MRKDNKTKKILKKMLRNNFSESKIAIFIFKKR